MKRTQEPGDEAICRNISLVLRPSTRAPDTASDHGAGLIRSGNETTETCSDFHTCAPVHMCFLSLDQSEPLSLKEGGKGSRRQQCYI